MVLCARVALVFFLIIILDFFFFFDGEYIAMLSYLFLDCNSIELLATTNLT